jgi:lambda family phage tail tape measure protein
MAMLARLGVVLGLDSAEFQKGISDANRKLDQISAQMPKFATIAGVAFAGATYKALQYADAVMDTAVANDLAVASVLALGTALQKNGGEADNAGRLLTSFTNKVDEATEGSLGAQKAFAKVGVSLNDIAKLDSQGLLDKTIGGLAIMDEPIKRNALAMELFGKASKNVDWRKMADGVDENRKEFEQYAQSIWHATELTDKLETNARNMGLAFTQSAIPAMNELFTALQKNAGVMKVFMGGIKVATETIAILIKYTSTVVVALIEDISFLGRTISNVFSGNFKEIEKDYKEHKENMQKMVAEDEEFARRILSGEIYENKEMTGTPFTGRDVKTAKDPEAEKAKKLGESLEKAKQITNEFEKQQASNLEQARLRAELNGLATKEKQIAEAVLKVREETSAQLAQIDLKIIDATIQGENEMVEVLRKVREEVELSGQSFAVLTEQQTRRIQETQNTFEFGWNKAFRQFAEDAQDNARIAGDMFNSITSNMTSAIDNFVRNGKFSFKDFTKSVIQDLIAIQLKAQAMRMFSGLGSIFGSMGTASQFGTTAGSQQTMMLQAQMAGFADGGSPPVGVPSIVGERGAELFIPKQAGTIIPNNQLSSVLGTGTTINYNAPVVENLSAIDTQSGMQFLMKNKESIWSANQSASRSLPASR